MKMVAFIFLILGFSQISYAEQVAQCLGVHVLDFSPVTAKIYSDAGVGRIIIEMTIDKVESPTKVDILPDSSVVVQDNSFQMFFTVSRLASAFPIQVFRDGAFFVEDFYCIRVN